MALVRDPAFWRRFSLAVHRSEKLAQDESVASSKHSTSPPESLKRNDSWLESQTRKKRRKAVICWVFWGCFFALIAVVVLVILWLKAKGMLANAPPSAASATSIPPAASATVEATQQHAKSFRA